MNFKKLIYLLFACSLVACVPEAIDETTETIIVRPPSVSIIGSVQGTILDENSQPLADAVVTIGTEMTTSDNDGLFSFTDIQLYEDGTLITAEKSGFIQSSNTLLAVEGGTNTVTISLIEKVITDIVDSQSGGTVNVGELSVDFPSGEYQNNSLGFSGDIHVFAKWLNPTEEFSFRQVPGDLSGINSSGNRISRIAFGNIIISIEDDDGNVLALPDGATAEISVTIPDNLVSLAPDRPILYHYDASVDNWIAKGEVTIVGDQYIAEISETGYWSISEEHEIVEVGNQLFLEAMPVANMPFRIKSDQAGLYLFGNTDESGFFRNRLPRNIELTIELMGECLSTPHRTQIGFFSEDIENNQILLNNDGLGDIKITGTTVSCNNNGQPALSHTYVRVDLGEIRTLQRLSDSGDFEIDLMTCSHKEVSISAIDANTGNASHINEYTLDSNVTTHSIQICEQEIQAGFSVNYTGINWNNILGISDKHSWTVREISGGFDLTLLDPRIQDEEGNTHMIAGFGVRDDSAEATYLIEFPTQGFSVRGMCQVSIQEHIGYNSYRFFDLLDFEINIIDSSVFPGTEPSDIAQMDFDLTYYD